MLDTYEVYCEWGWTYETCFVEAYSEEEALEKAKVEMADIEFVEEGCLHKWSDIWNEAEVYCV